MIVKHGNVLLFEEGGFVLRDIRVENGKIKEIAPELQAAEGEEVFDASGKYPWHDRRPQPHLHQRGGHGQHRG